ncbi:MAG: hypothetical protein J6Y62_02355, partial [Clostridia bacterium]|nr:hypothetical protein [Clostridia bacterium]
ARLKLAACDDFRSVLETARRTASEAVFMAILERSRKMDMGKRGKLQTALVKNHNFTCSFLEKIDYEGGFDWEEDEDVEEALVDRGVIEDK